MESSSEPTWNRRACVWKVLAIIPLTIIICGFVYLILQPDWYRYNDNITFGVVGGPYCDFNDTEIVKQCHEELKDFFRLGIGIPALFFMAVATAVLLFSANGIIMSVWFSYVHLGWSLLAQLFGMLCAFVGNILFLFHASNDVIGFNKPNQTIFDMEEAGVGKNAIIHVCLACLILLTLVVTFVSTHIQAVPEDEANNLEKRKWKNREKQLKNRGKKKGKAKRTVTPSKATKSEEKKDEKKEEKKEDKNKKEDKKDDKKDEKKEEKKEDKNKKEDKKDDKKDEKKEEKKEVNTKEKKEEKTEEKKEEKKPMVTMTGDKKEDPKADKNPGPMSTIKEPSMVLKTEGPKTRDARLYLKRKGMLGEGPMTKKPEP